MTYTGKDIIALGIEGGPHIPAMIARANEKGDAGLFKFERSESTITLLRLLGVWGELE